MLIIKFGFHFENLVGRMVQDGSPSNQKELLRLNFGIRVFLIAVITIESFISCCISIFSLFVSGWSKVNISNFYDGTRTHTNDWFNIYEGGRFLLCS